MEHTAVRFDHAAMYVRDLAAAKHFFEKYFGAESGALYHNTATGFRPTPRLRRTSRRRRKRRGYGIKKYKGL